MKKNKIPETPQRTTAVVTEPTKRTSKILLQFILRFAVLFLVFEACYFNTWLYANVFQKINAFFAFAASKMLGLIGITASSTGDTIANATFSISVKQGCDSIEALAIFVFGVIAFPATIKHKISGLLIGSGIILSLNLIRLVHLFWVGLHQPELFDLFHLEIWQGFFIILSIVLWLLWVMKAVKPSKINRI
jgi:exosortase H (IPTLxxWG-CTERM-specific)